MRARTRTAWRPAWVQPQMASRVVRTGLGDDRSCPCKSAWSLVPQEDLFMEIHPESMSHGEPGPYALASRNAAKRPGPTPINDNCKTASYNCQWLWNPGSCQDPRGNASGGRGGAATRGSELRAPSANDLLTAARGARKARPASCPGSSVEFA